MVLVCLVHRCLPSCSLGSVHVPISSVVLPYTVALLQGGCRARQDAFTPGASRVSHWVHQMSHTGCIKCLTLGASNVSYWVRQMSHTGCIKCLTLGASNVSHQECHGFHTGCIKCFTLGASNVSHQECHGFHTGCTTCFLFLIWVEFVLVFACNGKNTPSTRGQHCQIKLAFARSRNAWLSQCGRSFT